ncbi:hypothetical protein OESDEN_20835 [Oesophagostomum dentatum]|uniref:Uncharacterized protein n=1 Tax=Oesophagostomum dentatum TaxID=61180 RepID=A0A0B1S6J8_OESDE|nr:hypothetical protein OESDEN_20835 [Oesophagostomum dentatum]
MGEEVRKFLMEGQFDELLSLESSFAQRVLQMNVEHSERVDESTEILKELIKRQQAGLVTNEQAAEVDSACTNARLGHLFRADGSALYGTDLIAPNHFVVWNLIYFCLRYFNCYTESS